MTYITEKKAGSEAGFTLVELAIVMIIIGLLIGGVLKGQELIENARMVSVVGQIKAIDTGTSTFIEKYDALPGDIVGPTARLPNCGAAPCNTATAAGDGNGRISTVPDAAPGSEADAFFAHMAAAEIIGGVDPAGALAFAPGAALPEVDLNGGGIGYSVGFSAGAAGDFALAEATANIRPGHYLVLTDSANAIPTAAALTPNQAQRIDTKLDDGNSDTGNVRGMAAAADGCGTAGVYNEALLGQVCGLYIRIQQ